MKKRVLLGTLVAAMVYVFASSYSSMPGASGIDGTGAEGAGGCSCHGGVTTGITIGLELDSAGVAVTRYVGGQTYTIKITGTNTTTSNLPGFGFQVAAVLNAGAGTTTAANAGTLASSGLPTSCVNDLIGGGTINVVEHSSTIGASTGTGTTGSTYVESISWTAPTAGTGTIKLYGVVNAVNENGSTSGDHWNNKNVTITEEVPGVAPITGTATVCVGSTTTLADATAGGTWTSGSTGIATVVGGVVTGVTAGTAVISYNAGSAGIATLTVTVNPLPVTPPPIISTAATVCVGSTITCTETGTTGSWSSSATSIATVSSTGIVSGITAGIVTISYTNTNSCGSASATKSITVNSAPAVPAAISGTLNLCLGSTTSLTDATAGGAWSSVSTGIATISAGGVVTPLTSGTDTIKYTSTNTCGSTSAWAILTVNTVPAPPAPITGVLTVCAGSTTTLGETVPGGVWISTATGIATVGSTSGIVSGVSGGTDSIKYILSNSCGTSSTFAIFTVNPLPVVPAAITGTSVYCVGNTGTLTDATPGGNWSSSSAVATISSSGVITAVSAGTDTIKYVMTNTCGTTSAHMVITVNTIPTTPPGITGVSSLCLGSTSTFTDATGGGSWTSSAPGTLGITGTGGVATGAAAGTANVTYTVSNSCGTAYTTKSVTVTSAPGTPAAISGTLWNCPGTSTTLTDASAGGTWSSTAPATATIGATGIVTGIVPGTDTIYYTVVNSCGTSAAFAIVTVNPLPHVAAITGGSAEICYLSTTLFADSTLGGAWSVSNPSVATIGTGGLVSGVAAGLDTIKYSYTNLCGTATATAILTVLTTPYAGTISGSTFLCTGLTSLFTDAVTGGTWSVANTHASISAGGNVTGVTIGTDTILYTTSTPCGIATASLVVTVNVSPDAGAISGATTVCAGSTLTLTDYAGGGVWTASDSTLVLLWGTGVVNALAGGTETIDYTVSTACGTSVATTTFNIIAAPTAGAIAGSSDICLGTTTLFGESISGGIWGSTNPSVASVDATGLVTANMLGSATLTYAVTNACGSASTTFAVTVIAGPGSAGAIFGSDTVCVGAAITLSDWASGGIWSVANVKATVDASGIVVGNSAGFDTVFYTVSNTCGSNQAAFIVKVSDAMACWPLGIAGTKPQPRLLTVSPNPSTGTFMFVLPLELIEGRLTIENALGSQVFSTSLPVGQLTKEVEAGFLPAGTYIYTVSFGTEIYRGTLVLVK